MDGKIEQIKHELDWQREELERYRTSNHWVPSVLAAMETRCVQLYEELKRAEKENEDRV